MRKEKGWSQTQLAEKVGSRLGHISRIETGKYNPSVDILVKLAEALETSLDSLVGQNMNDSISEIRIEDQLLAERIKLLNSLDEEERNVVVKVIDAMLTKKRVLNALHEEEKAGKKSNGR